MKKSKIIIPALAMLVMSTAATVTGTVAWFTMNKTANAEGMVVSAKTSGSLIIKEAGAYPLSTDKATKVVFNDDENNPHTFYPSTHDWTVGTATGLKVVTNGADVNFETGTRKNEDTDLTYDGVDVPTGGAVSDYYFDYGLFIAGDGIAMSGQDITITLRNPDGSALTALDDINAALSVDFYGGAATSASMLVPSSSNYRDTLNLASKKNGVNGTHASITFSNVNIPKSGTNAAFAITMRVYYDGALIDNLVPDNDFAVYSPCTSTSTFNSNILYYSDENGTAVVAADSTTDLDGTDASGDELYYVNTASSTTCFARSIDVLNLVQQTINVHIEAGDHH